MGVVRQLEDPRDLGKGRLFRGAALAVMLALPALAMSYATARAQGANCAQLEASLASLDRTSGQRASQSGLAARLRGDLDRLNSQYRSLACDAPRGFLIFQGPPRPPQCDQLQAQISQTRGALANAERAGGGDSEGQRRALIIALAQNNCGPQYVAAVRPAAPAQQPQRPRNIFEAIFGGPGLNNEPETAPDLEVLPIEPPKASTFRTVCVRTCDGYFFPMSTYAGPNRFPTDEAMCKRLCPAADVQLFAYRSSGEDIKQATNIAGQSYMSLPNALRYRKEYVSTCSCRAPGQSWGQALAGLEDKTTLRKGDIIVTEEQSREMSQPKVEPTPGTRGKTARAPATTTTDADQGSLAATAAAPLAPATEQPGQRAVRVIPLPRSQNAANQAEAEAKILGTTPGAGTEPAAPSQ